MCEVLGVVGYAVRVIKVHNAKVVRLEVGE